MLASIRSEIIEKEILNLIREAGILSRTAINKTTGIRPTTISDVTRHLLDEGILLEGKDLNKTGEGEILKKSLLINKDYGRIIGIDISYPVISAGLSDFCATIIQQKSRSIRIDSEREDILAAVCELIDEMIRLSCGQRIYGISIVTTGMVNKKTQSVVLSTKLKKWNFTNLKSYIEKCYGLPTFLDDRVAACMYAEKWFGHIPADSIAVYIDMGFIFGVSVLTGNSVLHNANGTFGELGHFKVSEGNEICTCGNRGCLQTVASSDVILENIKTALQKGTQSLLCELYEKDVSQMMIADVLKAAEKNDRISITVLSEAARYVGMAVSYIINLFGPQTIIFGGELVENSDYFMRSVIDSIQDDCLPIMLKEASFRKSSFTNEAGSLIGAVCIALEAFYKIPDPIRFP